MTVKMDAFGAKTRNSNLQHKITKIRLLSSDFWESRILNSYNVRMLYNFMNELISRHNMSSLISLVCP